MLHTLTAQIINAPAGDRIVDVELLRDTAEVLVPLALGLLDLRHTPAHQDCERCRLNELFAE